MTFVPVVIRELRAEARNPANHWLRLVAVLLAIVVLFLAYEFMRLNASAARGGMGGFFGLSTSQMLGVGVFSGLNFITFFGAWIIAPILTADCLSREKREGTLGLLFLTPLTALGIVTAKGVIHALRALTLVIVMIPVAGVCLLAGGVGGGDVAIACLINLSSLLLALSAGIVASSGSGNWHRSVLAALALAALYFFVFVQGLSLVGSRAAAGLPWMEAFWLCVSPATMVMVTGRADAMLISAAIVAGATLLFFWVSLHFAAARLRRSWQDEPPSARQVQYEKLFLKPRFWKSRFRSKMSRVLDRNPIGWLQRYSWSARLAKWGWCLFIVVIKTWLLMVAVNDFDHLDGTLVVLLLIGLCFTSADSFIRERRSGAMELILVTPLKLNQIILGRLMGVWSQFVPTLVILGVCAAYWGVDRRDEGDEYMRWYWASSFLLVPVIGLYRSLRQKSFLGAWVMTLVYGLVIPVAVPGIFMALTWGISNYWYFGDSGWADIWKTAIVVQVIQSVLSAWQLFRRLRDRSFEVNLA